MIYINDLTYIYHIKNISFLFASLVIIQTMFYIPMRLFFKEKVNIKFTMSLFIFSLVYFLMYMDFLERLFFGMKIVNCYLIILVLVMVYSLLNYFMDNKEFEYQFFLLFLGFFMMSWFTLVQFLSIVLYDKFSFGSFVSFYIFLLAGIVPFNKLYNLFRIKYHASKRLIYLTLGLSTLLFLFFNLKNILIFSFKKNFLKIVAESNYIGKKFLDNLDEPVEVLYWELNVQIAYIILFILLTCVPAIIVVQMIIKRHQDNEIIHLQTKREDELKKYIQMIESINQETRQLQHDIGNVLSSLGMYVYQEEVDISALQRYYDQVNQEFGLRKITKIPNGKLTHLKNPEVLGLVLDKFMRAKELGVFFHLEIDTAIKFPTKHLLPIIRILAILLDNALEESEKYSEATVHLAFIDNNENQILTVIENRSLTQDFIQQFLSGDIQSDKGNGRGQGLRIITSLVKENNHLYLDCKQIDQIVRFSLMVDGES